MNSIKEISLAVNDQEIKGTEHLNDTNKAINFINEKFEEFKKDMKKKEEKIKFLGKENSYLNKRPDEMDAVPDRLM